MNFTPLHDMILVKPDQRADKIGSIFVPPGSIQGPDQPGNPQDTGIGTVVAIGPGDRILHGKCSACGRTKTIQPRRGGGFGWCKCGVSTWETIGEDRLPMLMKIGDRVVFPRRPSSAGGDFSLKIDGETYMTFNEEQSSFAVLED